MQSVRLLCNRVILIHSPPLNVAATILHSLNQQILFLRHKLHLNSHFIAITIEMQTALFILHIALMGLMQIWRTMGLLTYTLPMRPRHIESGLTSLILGCLTVQHQNGKNTSGLAGIVKIVLRLLNGGERLQLLNGSIVLSVVVMKRLTYHRLPLFNRHPSHHFIILPRNRHNR